MQPTDVALLTAFVDLLDKMLALEPAKRISPKEALNQCVTFSWLTVSMLTLRLTQPLHPRSMRDHMYIHLHCTVCTMAYHWRSRHCGLNLIVKVGKPNLRRAPTP